VIAVTGRAPDLIAPVVGFRIWRLCDGILRSAWAPETWTGATITAHCDAGCEPPQHRCTCGVHAWHRQVPYTATNPTRDLVAGAVVVWGRVAVHETGVRAEHARVIALARPLGRRKRAAVEEVAARLGVPIVGHRDLARVAGGVGAPVPVVLRPIGCGR
jgi:hypothetical protein